MFTCLVQGSCQGGGFPHHRVSEGSHRAQDGALLDCGGAAQNIRSEVIVSLIMCFKHYCVAGEAVLCVAHGTSLRGIVKHIEQLSDEEICSLDLPNGIPIVYRSGHGYRWMIVTSFMFVCCQTGPESQHESSSAVPGRHGHRGQSGEESIQNCT